MSATSLTGWIDPLTDPEHVPLLPRQALRDFGATLVIAPHPDDESLGCGGTLALLHDRGLSVRVVVVSDGSGSHPGSHRFPPEALARVRQSESREAGRCLGLGPTTTGFLGLPDGRVPTPAAPGFAEAAALLRADLVAARFRPATVLLPWRRDPHCDHRASAQLARAALADLRPAPRLLEYPIWAWQAADPRDRPAPGEVLAWRLDLSGVLPRKRAAIAAHRSQTSDLIDDDPSGFRLTAEMLAHFTRPWELFLEQAP